jgi:biotin transport system substrate-specific component
MTADYAVLIRPTLTSQAIRYLPAAGRIFSDINIMRARRSAMNPDSSPLHAPTLRPQSWFRSRAVNSLLLAIAGSLALAVSAKIQVPFWPVPMTMQSLVVLLIGVAFGSRLGALMVLAYLVEGLAGLPVFAGATAGPAYMAGPTAGYLVGFVASVIVVGRLAERGWSGDGLRMAVTMTLGHVVLFIPGVLWLAVLFGWPQAVASGVAPFILATALKTGLGVGIVAACRALVRGRRPIRG